MHWKIPDYSPHSKYDIMLEDLINLTIPLVVIRGLPNGERRSSYLPTTTVNNRQQPSTTDNNRQQPTTNLQLPTTTVNDPDQPTTSAVWLNILFIRSAKNSSGMFILICINIVYDHIVNL